MVVVVVAVIVVVVVCYFKFYNYLAKVLFSRGLNKKSCTTLKSNIQALKQMLYINMILD